MHIAFLNPQGNFDPHDHYLTQHPDFGGQLVYVKQLAVAMAALGHRVDILTRQVNDPAWPEFAKPEDTYPDVPNVRILRITAGPEEFLRKELLWPHIVHDWVPNILAHYEKEGTFPDAFTGHYADGGLAGALIQSRTGLPYTFTAHSLGAQKMDQIHAVIDNLPALDAHFFFARRIMAERLSMNHAAVNITSTRMERMEQYGHHAYRGAVDVNDDSRFIVIPPGVNLGIFHKGTVASGEIATQENIEAMLVRDITAERRNFPAIIASSRLDPKKNIISLVKAYAHHPGLQRRANLVIFSGAHNDALRDDSEATPVERQVLREIRYEVEHHQLWGKISAFSLNSQSELATAYRFFAARHSVFALTALYEPFGLAPLEAAAAGLPLVVTQNGGPSESLREGDMEYAILIDPIDEGEIARGLNRLMVNDHLWETYATRAYQRVLDRYTWERTAQAYLDVLAACCAETTLPFSMPRLDIHPYFLSGDCADDVPLTELKLLYEPPA